MFLFLTVQEQIDVCKLFGVNVTIHDLHSSRDTKNSFRITEVGFVVDTSMNTS